MVHCASGWCSGDCMTSALFIGVNLLKTSYDTTLNLSITCVLFIWCVCLLIYLHRSRCLLSKVPQPAPVRYLVTAEELKSMRGKLRSLSKLFKHPRRTLPSLQPYISSLLTAQNSFVNCTKLRYTEEGRAKIEAGVIAMKHLEDIVIRVIIQGEEPARAHMRVINDIYPFNSDDTD